MSPAQWQRVCQLVDAVASAPPEAQQRLLEQAAEESLVRAEAERLLGRISSAGGFLSHPLAGLPESRRFEPGTRIAGRFVIRRFIGAGGMGEVYEAFDEHLNESRALKTLLSVWVRDEGHEDERMAELFRREVQLSLRVTHPNVVRIYDIGEHRDPNGGPVRVFFTMELVDGVTLAQGIKEHRWNPEVLADLLRQTAAGLAAAHKIGVVHRDLKPANILVRTTNPPTAIVTDFGLAKVVTGGPRLGQAAMTAASTGKHDGAGTPAYMAPECFEGSAATAASDVYSLGLIYYEALTGALPFSHLPLLGALVSRGRSRPPVDSRALRPEWRRVILRCLEPDPARRFQSAEDVTAALEGKIVWSRRRLLQAGSVAAGVALSVPAYRYGSRWLTWRPADESLLLTPPVAGVADLDVGWLDVAMRKTLEQSERLKLWDRSRFAEVWERMARKKDEKPDPAAWRDLAFREGFRQLAFWTVIPVGDGFTMTVRLEQLNASSPRFAEANPQATFQAVNKQGLFDVVRDASRWMRRTMGESAVEMGGANRVPQDITTSSPEALAAFARGEETLQKDRAAAIADYDEALRRDPNFTMAPVRKGDALSSESRMADALRTWKLAIVTSAQRPLSRKEDLELRAMYALDSGDLPSGERVYSEYIQRFPTDWRGYFFREFPLVWLNRIPEGIEMLRRSLQYAPSGEARRVQVIRLHLGWNFLALNDSVAARQEVRSISDTKGNPVYADWLLGTIHSHLNDWSKASDVFARAAEKVSWPLRSTMIACQVVALSESGALTRALTVSKSAAKSCLELGLRARAAVHFVHVGFLTDVAKSTHSTEIREAALEAVDLDHSPEILGYCATLLGRSGALRELRGLLGSIPSDLDAPRYRVAAHRIQGELALLLEKRQVAAREFEASAIYDFRPYGNDLLVRSQRLMGNDSRALDEQARLDRIRSFYPRNQCPLTRSMGVVQ